METLTLELGALCDPVSKQLAGHAPAEKLERFDRMADAITTCVVLGLIGETEGHRARKRLMRKICAEVGLPTRKR